MAQGQHVFLSYRSTERSFALKLAASLRNAGVQLWVDCLPEGIHPGDDWPRTLEEALNSCASAIAVLSPDYAASKVCRRELHRVDQLGRVIFPLLLHMVPPTDWPLEIERLQYIDFTGWMNEAAYELSVKTLVARLRGSGGAVIGQRPDPEQQYLLTLIADLEARGGVSQYVTLDAELRPDAGAVRLTIPSFVAAWGLDPEFTLLESGNAPVASTPAHATQPVNIQHLVQTPHRFVLLGDPGGGKTTTLRRLALEVARHRLDDRHAPLPLLLSLPQWQREPDPASFIAAHYPFDGDPQPAVASGDIALFLDGLNEMGRDTTRRVELLRQWLLSPNSPRRLAVTCRTQDYAECDLGVERVAIKPMDQQRVEQFVTCYLGDRSAALLERILPGFGHDGARSLFTIARNPYVLTCLILLHRSAPEGELPRNMGRLFRRLVRYLWDRELRRQTVGWVPFAEGEAKLSALAFDMIERYRPTTVPRTEANATVDEELLRFCERASVLVAEDDGVRFHHQLIQEYLAAVALLDRPLDDCIAQSRWREVIVALSGILDNADAMVQRVCSKDVKLAARCLLGGALVEDTTIGSVVRDLIRALESWSEHLAAGAENRERARTRELAAHPDMHWGSTAAMDDALDFSFIDHPREEIEEIAQLLEALGPVILPWISAAARQGPAAAILNAFASRLAHEEPSSGVDHGAAN